MWKAWATGCVKYVFVEKETDTQMDGGREREREGETMGVVLFDLILYVPSTIFQLNRDGSSWVEPVLS